MDQKRLGSLRARYQDTLADFFRGQPDTVTNVPCRGWNQGDYAITPAPLTEVLTEGFRIDLGGVAYRVLHLPGHPPGSIALLDERGGVLFSGNAIYGGTLVDNLPGCDRGEYRRTMEHLCELDISTAFGGHGNPISRERTHGIAAIYLNFPT
jgi:glyoxylase-like metal-dependent hydrolase (beta-lactamase superfamily II)